MHQIIIFPFNKMKKIILLLILTATACTGCATRYSLTLNNGDVITARGKPRFDKEKNRYYFKNAYGQPDEISAFKVREIAPSSMADKGGSQLTPGASH